jgi:hypothetical protein
VWRAVTEPLGGREQNACAGAPLEAMATPRWLQWHGPRIPADPARENQPESMT